ncbi:CRISPR-associated ring nuclease [Maridesulfovibrio sp.]|uniref:CRISPR-associated ring nuclease n=1 Tax=Maridesulfovibrio sp. TaxID=2795000 RepID=UPI0039F083F8
MGVNDGGKKKGVALLVLSGVNPQLVTEALYALHRECADSESEYYNLEYPDKVHVITTKEGQNSLYSGLGYDVRTMSKQNVNKMRREKRENPGTEFKSFCEDYGREDVVFTPQNVHVISDGDKPFVDITNAKDSRIAEVFIMHEVMELAEHNTIYAVIGGRASMSVFLYTTFQILGEGGHRVFHIPAGKKLMESPDLFYPALDQNTGQPNGEEDELIDLCELPVFPVGEEGRTFILPYLAEIKYRYDDLSATLFVVGNDVKEGYLVADNYALRLETRECLVYLLLLHAGENGVFPSQYKDKISLYNLYSSLKTSNVENAMHLVGDKMFDSANLAASLSKLWAETEDSALKPFGVTKTKKGSRSKIYHVHAADRVNVETIDSVTRGDEETNFLSFSHRV